MQVYLCMGTHIFSVVGWSDGFKVWTIMAVVVRIKLKAQNVALDLKCSPSNVNYTSRFNEHHRPSSIKLLSTYW